MQNGDLAPPAARDAALPALRAERDALATRRAEVAARKEHLKRTDIARTRAGRER